MDSIKWYIENRPIYKRLAYKIESILAEIFEIEGIPFHMIQSRAKDIDSFSNKITGDKYSNPIEEVQDFAGIRVVTYVEDEVKKVCELIEKIFKIDNGNSSDKSESLGIDKVGYKSVHYVCYLKSDRLKLPENEQFKDRCFEIQVRTILQHAWAEIEHDRNYKFAGILPKEINRRFKLLAGTLELADREFNNIASDIDKISNIVKTETKKGNFDIKINSTSFSEYIKNRFKKIQKSIKIYDLQNDNIVTELNSFGIFTLQEFENIIPADFENQYLKEHKDNNEKWAVGFVRAILIISDYDKYFKNCHTDWARWSKKGDGLGLFTHYNIDWNAIEDKYNVTFMK